MSMRKVIDGGIIRHSDVTLSFPTVLRAVDFPSGKLNILFWFYIVVFIVTGIKFRGLFSAPTLDATASLSLASTNTKESFDE